MRALPRITDNIQRRAAVWSIMSTYKIGQRSGEPAPPGTDRTIVGNIHEHIPYQQNNLHSTII